jgi:acyl dehydratase
MDHPNPPDISVRLKFGTYDEAGQWIGRAAPPRPCEDEINWPQIKYFCSLVRDANPNYWDEAAARERYGAIIAPPGMLMVWQTHLRWRPDGAAENWLLAAQVPLPGDTFINVSTDTEFFLPMKIGDHLTVEEQVVDVSPEKRTRLGVGHFITTLTTFRNQTGVAVATNRNVLFRFLAGSPEGAA